MELTRRHALAGAAALAASPLLPSAPANAAAPMADKQAPSFYRYKVGDVQVTVISDGVNTFALGDSFILNAKKDEVAAALEKAYMPKDKVSIQFGPLVINSGGKLIVLDTGNGPGAFASSKGAVGQFATNMAAAGFDPKAVDMVVISHFHGDHINGLLNAEGAPAFANAEVLVPSVEWKYFMDDGEISGSGKVFIQSDVTNVPYLFAANPGWHAFFDQDADMAEKARRKTYDMLVADKLQVQGFHYPFPGLGNVEKDGNGYRVIPAPWNPVI